MNPRLSTRPGTQIAAFAMAVFLTVAMLGGVDFLATSDPSPQLLAHVKQGSAKT